MLDIEDLVHATRAYKNNGNGFLPLHSWNNVEKQEQKTTGYCKGFCVTHKPKK